MKNITKTIMAAMAALTFTLSPIYAQENKECQYASYESFVAQIAEQHITSTKLTDQEKQTLVTRKGNPPQVDMSKDWDAYLITSPDGTLSAINIFQDGCLVQRLGPGPAQIIDRAIHGDDGSI